MVIFWQISTIISVAGGAQYVASDQEVFRKSLRLANFKKGQKLYELGSGLGNNLIIAAKEFEGKITGIEISPWHYLFSCFKTYRYKNIKIIRANFYKIDLSSADVVYCYLFSRVMDKLLAKFKKNLKKGAMIISYAFPIKKLKANKIIKINHRHVYFYKF